MKKIVLLMSLSLFFLFSCTAQNSGKGEEISGTLKGGLRYLPVDTAAKSLNYTVYRGDYIVFELQGNPLVFSVPDLGINAAMPRPETEDPYVKIKESGTFAFTLGDLGGTLVVKELTEAHYREVTADEAAELISQTGPYVLDVRTEGEYRGGHLPDAEQIPVQVLAENLDKLSEYKDSDILVYCASGNRSTVASRLLIDAGFTRVYNLRYGFGDWARKGYPVE